jgi:hypothetical protein
VLQSAVVWMWRGVLPLALLPLWHDAQLPVTPLWSKRAESQFRDEWQLAQSWVVAMWVVGFPAACNPLWHEAHVPVTAL